MDPMIPALITAVAVGAVIGMLFGFAAAQAQERKKNRALADQMMASVGATRSRRRPEDMLEYDYRQRVADNNNNGKKARQARLRPRRVMRRPQHRN
ncbi:membrane protein [Arthrobacter phage Wollypog]|uniref:Membrane protein n=1 Tax=Arthrobacter phage Wollypog TaxID=2790985 RepID=A0A7T3N278_9CAUD|nr:membrane protein [Arthrobacter phage Wollypog]QPX62596.1 membrane protein [Arthrobacter phage Wollypog]